MKPKIERTRFGAITIAGETYPHDVLIRLDGQVKKRKKQLSKQVYGTSHRMSLEEAQHVYEPGAQRLIYGTGHFGRAGLSEGAAEFFEQNNCQVALLPMSKAVQAWNEAQGAVIGLFHVSC